MKRNIATGVIVFVAAAIIFGGGFFYGRIVGQSEPKTIIVRGVSGTDGGETATGIDFSVFWQAWAMINDNYLKADDIEGAEKVHGAIRGLVNSLGDPHSVFLDPEDNKKFQEDIQGNFGGIGAEIGIRKEQLVVVSPLKDTPAFRAGLKPGDQILLINTTSTEGIAVDEAVRMIRGLKGTEVTLTILREGWEKPKEFKIVRDTIVVPTLDFTMREGNIAHVELHSFNANSNLLFYDAAFQTLSRGARGMVLDLRNNPGGYLEVAVQLAGWFLPRGALVVSEVSRIEEPREFRAEGNTALKDFPIVILVNEGSASASEILAGALRDNREVKLVGERTFGKGTVQQLLDLKDNSSLKLTIAHWVLPSGEILENEKNGGGLKPDYEVIPSDEDVESENDVQLTKAIEVLRGVIANNAN